MTSLEWWKTRPAAQSAELPDFPTLDDAWLWFLVGRERAGAPLPETLSAMCVYAEDVRQGRWPDRVPPEFALQSVYLALAQEHLVGGSREKFQEEARALFELVVAHLEKGGSLIDDAFLKAAPAMQRYISALREDHRLFAEDLKRARKLEVTLPPEASPSGNWRSMRLLVLDRPSATQFKLWARRDSDCALLLVRQKDGLIVLSADPTRKVKLGWLAGALSAKEGKPWYDGARHEGTLVASPKEGSSLELEGVLEVLATRARVVRRRPAAALAALGGSIGIILIYLFSATHDVEPSMPSPAPAGAVAAQSSGAKGEPIPPAKVVDLLAADDGPRSYEGYALVAGVCGYQGEHQLDAPCRDARAVRELLVKRLGYKPENVLFFVDVPAPGEATDGVPTAANLKLAVEKFRDRTNADETSSFFFYYSGHGGYEKGARKDYGVLQPSGYFEHPDQPMSVRGWDMQELLDDLRKGVPSKHVMVVLDTCYSGWAVGAKGDERLSDELKSLWAERAEVVLTAGTKGQRAWEDEPEPGAWQWGGHSALTAFLLEGLGASGAPQADANRDAVVTDEELARFVKARVPTAVRELKRAEQHPQFFRFDEHLPRSGQFLFLPGATP
ncbi:MAG: caspase family protein [Myxococcota bacterium]|jgi:hypothetical protein